MTSSLYTALLFLHIASAILLFTAEGVVYFGLRELRAAPHQDAARLALARIHTVGMLGKLMPIVLLLSALALCALAWGFTRSWVLLSLLGFVGIAATVQLVDHPRLSRLDRLIAEDLPAEQFRPALHDPILRRAVRARLGLLLWLVFLMTVKPTLPLGLGALLLVGACVLLVPMPAERHRSLTPA